MELHSPSADGCCTGNATHLCHFAGDAGSSKAPLVIGKPASNTVGGLPRQPDFPKEELCKLHQTCPSSQDAQHTVLHEAFSAADIPLRDLDCSCSSSKQLNRASTRSIGSVPEATTYYGGTRPTSNHGPDHFEDQFKALGLPHHPNGSGDASFTTYSANLSISSDSQAESGRERCTHEERHQPPVYSDNSLPQTRSPTDSQSDPEQEIGISNTNLADENVCERKVNNSAWLDELRARWGRLEVCERVMFTMASLVVLASFVILLAVLGTVAKGKKDVGRRIFLGCILLAMAASGTAMVAVRRNLGEVLFTMIMVVVIGMFLNSFLDILV
jgi:hypothetical protein